MNKKLICIGILGLFLLTTTSSLSAASIIEASTTSNAEEVDLVVRVEKIRLEYIVSSAGGFWGHIGYICVKNIGTAPLIKSSDTSRIATRLIAEYKGEIVLDAVLDLVESWEYNASIDESIEPGEELCIKNYLVEFWPDDEECMVAPPGSNLTLIINCDNNIPEGDYTNNKWQGFAPKIRSHEHNRALFSLLCRFPIFQRVLEKLVFFT